jgi:uncharacterized membrane protein YgaE (UPF0421/DUF939 family)
MTVDRYTLISGIQLATRAAAGAALSLAIAEYFGLQYPIYAFIAAVIVTDLSPNQCRQLGLRRIVATLIGAACGALLSEWLPSNPWTIGLGVLIALFLCHVFGARDGARVSGYICGLVLLAHSNEPWFYAFHRFVETVLGIVVAWAISYVPKLIKLDEPEDSNS